MIARRHEGGGHEVSEVDDGVDKVHIDEGGLYDCGRETAPDVLR